MTIRIKVVKNKFPVVLIVEQYFRRQHLEVRFFVFFVFLLFEVILVLRALERDRVNRSTFSFIYKL